MARIARGSDGFAAAGECEFVDAFAKRLPIVVFLRLVGLPLEDRETLLEMTEASVRGDAQQRQGNEGSIHGPRHGLVVIHSALV